MCDFVWMHATVRTCTQVVCMCACTHMQRTVCICVSIWRHKAMIACIQVSVCMCAHACANDCMHVCVRTCVQVTACVLCKTEKEKLPNENMLSKSTPCPPLSTCHAPLCALLFLSATGANTLYPHHRERVKHNLQISCKAL